MMRTANITISYFLEHLNGFLVIILSIFKRGSYISTLQLILRKPDTISLTFVFLISEQFSLKV